MQHQLIVWQGAGGPPTTDEWKKLLLEAGIFPFEASTPDANAEFHFLPDASRCNSFRWRGEPEILEVDFEHLTQEAVGSLHQMLDVHDWCMPGTECRVPRQFLRGIDPPFGIKYAWLQIVYDVVSEWPAMVDGPAWMPKTRELVGTKARARLIETQDAWMLSAEAVTRWLPPDVDDFLSAWKTISRSTPEMVKPKWVAATSTLTYEGQVIKRFRQPAPNQKAVLAAFQKANWPSRIPDPLSSKVHRNPKRFGDTVRQLNETHITPALMYFEMDGNNQGVIWNPGPKPIPKPAC